MKKFFSAGVITLGLSVIAPNANAVIAYRGSADVGNNFAASGSVFSGPYTVNTASNMLEVLVLNNNADGSTFGVTFNGASMTLACTSPTSNSAGTTSLYYLMSPTTGTHNVVVTASSAVSMQIGAADYSGVGAFESCKPNNGSSPVTTTVGTKSVNDWVMLATGGYTTQTAGSGDTLRVQDGTYAEWGLFDSNAGLTIGNHSLTTSLATSNAITHLAAVFSPANPGAIPTAINCVSASPSLTNTAVNGSTVCALTVTMSDGSAYTGSNTVTPTSTFAVPATGNGNLTLSRALTAADDGFLTAAVNATQNNAIVSKNITLTVVPASVAGTPFAMGWKNADPGGQVIFTAPHTYTVGEITMRVTVPASSPALIDVYKAASGTLCASGTKLHSGDFNAAYASDQVQVLPLVAGTSALAINDSVCVVTQQPFAANGQATLTVTAN